MNNIDILNDEAVDLVIKSSGVSLEFAREKKRSYEYIFPRDYIFNELRNLGFKLQDIGSLLNVHYSTVIYSSEQAKLYKDTHLIYQVYHKHAKAVYNQLSMNKDKISVNLPKLDYNDIIYRLIYELSTIVYNSEIEDLDRHEKELLSWQMIYLGCRYTDVLYLNHNFSNYNLTDEAVQMDKFITYYQNLKAKGLDTYANDYLEISKIREKEKELVLANL